MNGTLLTAFMNRTKKLIFVTYERSKNKIESTYGI